MALDDDAVGPALEISVRLARTDASVFRRRPALADAGRRGGGRLVDRVASLDDSTVAILDTLKRTYTLHARKLEARYEADAFRRSWYGLTRIHQYHRRRLYLAPANGGRAGPRWASTSSR